MGKLTLFVNESANDPKDALVESFLSGAPARPIVFTQGDTARAVEVHFLADSQDASNNAGPFVYGTLPDSLKFGVGPLDPSVLGGTYTITDTAGSQTTAAIAYNAADTVVQAAVRAGLTTNFSTATVVGSYTAGFVLDRVATGALADITVSVASITPENSVAEILNTDQGTASLSEKWNIKIVQTQAIKTTIFSTVTYTAAAAASVTTGSAGVNAVHSLIWPAAAYAGSISISQQLPTGSSKAITSNTIANPTVVSATSHGLATGDKIVITTNNGTVPTIVGVQTVTVSDANTFTIPINASTGGSGGSFYKLLTATVGPIPYNVGTTALEDLFELQGSTLAVDGNFSAVKIGPGSYLVNFTGTLGSLNIPAGTVSSNLSTPVAMSGTLNCKTAGVLSLLGSAQEVTTKLEIEKTVSATPTTIAYADTVTIRAEIISS